MFQVFQEVLRNQFKFLFFRPLRPNPSKDLRIYLGWGLFTTWLVGIGRYWDHPDAEWWQYAGLGSVIYVFVLALILKLIVAPLRPENFSYENILVFITLTSLPALLYAIPVERFVSMENAIALNSLFLATVAIWRVALYFGFLRRVARLDGFAAFVATLLPLCLIVVALSILNLEHAVIESKETLLEPTSNDGSYLLLVLISNLSILVAPLLILSYAIAFHRVKMGKCS